MMTNISPAATPVLPSALFSVLLRTTLSGLLIAVCAASVLAQDIQYTENSADQSLKSNARINPSTRAMELSIPLGSYQGRGGTSIPVVINYSSKVWRMDFQNYFCANAPRPITETAPRFAERSASGWTGSLGAPRLEYTGQEQVYDREGKPVSDGFDGCGFPAPDQPPRYYVKRITIQMPDGSSHELRKDDNAHELNATNTNYDWTGAFYAVDGSRLIFNFDTNTLYLPDGGRYIFAHVQDGGSSFTAYLGTQYVDRNGNTLSYDPSTRQWTDTLGRVLSQPLPLSGGQPPAVGDFAYSAPGVGGAGLNYTLSWGHLKDPNTGASVLADPGQPLHWDAEGDCQGQAYYERTPALFSSEFVERRCGVQVFNPIVLSKVTLPNGQAYEFKYNVYGEIVEIKYPSGGYERFEYAQVGAVNGVSPLYAIANRGVRSRWVGAGNGAAEAVWQYTAAYTGAYGGTPLVAATTAPDGTRTERALYAMPYTNCPSCPSETPFGFGDARIGMAYEERVYNSAGTMLRRKLTEWTTTSITINLGYTAQRDPRVTKEVDLVLDTGGNALASTTTLEYDAAAVTFANLNVTATNRYAFAEVDQYTAQNYGIGLMPTGALLRREETSYLYNGAYLARNMTGLPASSRVKNAAGNIVAQSTIGYDGWNYPLLTYGGGGGGDPDIVDPIPDPSPPVGAYSDPAPSDSATTTSTSANNGWSDPGTTARGNATTTRRWLDTNNTWVETHAQYDQYGNLRRVWDGRGALSQINYTDAFADGLNRGSYAFPTSMRSATPDPSNVNGANAPLETTSTYDFSTGLVTSTRDANGATTTFEYNDVMNRLTKVTRPAGGGWTSYRYVDVHPHGAHVETRTAIDAGRETSSYQFFDALGRAVRAFNRDGGQWITADTQYDAMGRVWRVSNPYRSAGSAAAVNPSGRWTTTGYDALGRVLTTTTPDTAVVSVAYSGNTVTVTEQTGKQRKSETDALGRLAAVVEDPAGLAYRTNYGYDTLGHLRRVEQGGQNRYFMYDSLSRLIRARNPEQGTLSRLGFTDFTTNNSDWSLAYGYDANGNLISRVDARDVETTYGYDALNRNTTVRYSDGTGGVDRYYDTGANNRGGLWRTCSRTFGESCTDTEQIDVAGRPKLRRQWFHSSTGWRYYDVGYEYNESGGVTTQRYPSGRVVNYSYDDAGRTSGVNGTLGDWAQRTYSTGITYDEQGGLAREQFGTDAPLYHKRHYNVRGQLYDVRLSSVNDEWNWNRGAIVNWYSANGVHGGSGADNNGNVVQSHSSAPLDDAISQFAYMEARYNYDALNRLAAVAEYQGTPGSLTQSGAQSYIYDRWGNRTINTAQTWGAGINNKAFDVDAATNRLKTPASYGGDPLEYDAAGNLSRDTYSGFGYRSYDAENRLTRADGGYSSGYYTYDGDGKRVRRAANGFYSQEWYVYGIGGELLAEYGYESGTAWKEYAYRNGEMLVTAGSGGDLRWMVSDQLGTPRIVVDRSGSLAGIRRHDYLPFGEELAAGVGGRTEAQGYVGDNLRQKWAQLERDAETGLDYAINRYYSSTMGRFTSVDPALGSIDVTNPQTLNRYTYALNNPLAYIDPDGLEALRIGRYEDLTDEQKRLFQTYVDKNYAKQIGDGDAAKFAANLFNQSADVANGTTQGGAAGLLNQSQLTTFLGVTSMLEARGVSGEVKSITTINGDQKDDNFRIYGELKGAESGKVIEKAFSHGIGGSGHEPYDISRREQGLRGQPNGQVSMTRDRLKVDVDVDYRRLLSRGHNTKDNSDIRADDGNTSHYRRHIGRYGPIKALTPVNPTFVRSKK